MSKIDELLKRVGADFDLENKKIKATVSKYNDNIVNIRIEVLEDNTVELEVKAFEEYISTLPDDLFMEVIEYLGHDESQRINDCIYSGNLESVRSGILKFKQSLKKVIEARMEELSSILPSC